MVSFKFIHAADLHLDSQFKGISGLSDDIRAFLRESTFASLERLTELAVRERADFMVISGDVYDAKDASLQAQLRFREALDRLGEHGIAVYVIHGNHDPLDGPRMGTSPKEHVHVFGPEFERVVAYRRQDRRPAAVIGGISYPTAKVTENTSRYFERSKDSSLFHIALLHANVDGDPAHETYSPCTRSDLNAAGYHYWALGHIHKRQILQENPHIVYPGNIQGRSIRETGAKGCYAVQVDEEGNVGLRFHELDTVRWFREELAIDGLESEESFHLMVEARLEAIRRERPGEMSIVRFTVIGRGRLHDRLEEGMAEELLHAFRRQAVQAAEGPGGFRGLVWIESFEIRSGPWIDREALLQEDSFLGELLRYGKRAGQDERIRSELFRGALQPLAANGELRRLLAETSEEERMGWLRRAEEMAVMLLADLGPETEGDKESDAH